MAKKTLTFDVWDSQVRGTDPDAKVRGITSPSDWRDADVLVPLKGARIEVRDQAFLAHSGPNEPDWSKGWYCWIQNAETSNQPRILFESSGEHDPPEWVKKAKMNGLTLEGVIILRDTQHHG